MTLISNIKASYEELINKVSWPTWSELMNSAVIVLIASVIIALIVALMDISFENLMDFVYGLFEKGQ